MIDCDDHFACALREVTRRSGGAIWNEPGRLRSRLQYEVGAVSTGQSALLDALVIAAMQGIPGALLDHDDLQPCVLDLDDSVGPALAADAVGVWMRALAEPELVCVELELPAIVVDRAPRGLVIDARCVEVRVLEPAPCERDDAVVEERVLTLIDKLRPPPPVPVSA